MEGLAHTPDRRQNTGVIKRRLFAALALIVFAIGSSLFWNEGKIEWLSMSSNQFAALIGFLFLHFRWRGRERRALTPKQAQDIFS